MQLLKPAAQILEHYYRDTTQNLKLQLSHKLDRLGETEPGLRHAVTRTVYGVMRRQRLLDHVIRGYSNRKLGKIQTGILVLLRIGVYLLLYSESYPEYAVVNEAVASAKGSSKAKGFLNALLRGIARDKNTILASLEYITDPAVRYSVSDILVENLKQVSSNVNRDLDYLNREPLFHLRIDAKRTSPDEAVELLTQQGIAFKELNVFPAFEIKESGQAIRSLLAGKRFYFQNTASQLISIIAARFARKRVLDCCAAPGTKSVTLSLSNPSLPVVASDIHPRRMSLLADFINEYGITGIQPMVSDAKQLGLKGDTALDFIIVDAPCTSSGTLRKNPDLKLKIDEAAVERNSMEQLAIMTAILERFPKTKYVLYTVCSFIHDEAEGLMARLTRENPASLKYKSVDLTPLLEEFGFNYTEGTYGYYLLPSEELNNDLFYLSLLVFE